MSGEGKYDLGEQETTYQPTKGQARTKAINHVIRKVFNEKINKDIIKSTKLNDMKWELK